MPQIAKFLLTSADNTSQPYVKFLAFNVYFILLDGLTVSHVTSKFHTCFQWLNIEYYSTWTFCNKKVHFGNSKWSHFSPSESIDIAGICHTQFTDTLKLLGWLTCLWFNVKKIPLDKKKHRKIKLLASLQHLPGAVNKTLPVIFVGNKNLLWLAYQGIIPFNQSSFRFN